MVARMSSGLLAAVAGVVACLTAAQAFEDTKYPDWSGQWIGTRSRLGGQPPFDPTKAWGKGQNAPLTAEYEAVLDASIADQDAGGQGNWQSGARCVPPGMPGMMNAVGELEIVILPETTYMLVEHDHDQHRRIFTDGRDWPAEPDPAYRGYSIGKWIDSDGDGRFDVLEVETRYFRGIRVLDPRGMPTHKDNLSVVKERIYLDAADPNLLHDDVTLIDHAFTRPWTVPKSFRREVEKYPVWREENCPGVTALIKIGNEVYYHGGDGKLAPTRKDQPPPDLRYFTAPQAQK